MAKTRFTHICGHDGVVVESNRKRADYIASRRAEEKCWDCDRADRSVAAAQANTGLPTLVGSPKQIAWAETIRAGYIKTLDETLAKLLGVSGAIGGLSPAGVAEVHDALALIQTEIRGQTNASWWIDNRTTEPTSRELLQQIKARGLAPTAVAENETCRAARRAAAEG